MVLFEEDEVEALKGEKIKTLEDLKKVKNPKTKKKIAGKIVAAIALALGIPIIKVATMLSRDPEGTGELFKSNTIVELAKQASKENKEALTKAGEKGLSGVGDYVKNFLKGKSNDAVSGIGDLSLKKWEDDKFASGIGKAFGKVASRILRAFRFVADGDGSANGVLHGTEHMRGMLEDVNMLDESLESKHYSWVRKTERIKNNFLNGKISYQQAFTEMKLNHFGESRIKEILADWKNEKTKLEQEKKNKLEFEQKKAEWREKVAKKSKGNLATAYVDAWNNKVGVPKAYYAGQKTNLKESFDYFPY